MEIPAVSSVMLENKIFNRIKRKSKKSPKRKKNNKKAETNHNQIKSPKDNKKTTTPN